MKRRVPLQCSCCELHVIQDVDGRHAVYVLNGVAVRGRDNFAARLGLTRDGMTTRMRQGRCFGGGIAFTSGDLAQQFVANMGRAFVGAC